MGAELFQIDEKTSGVDEMKINQLKKILDSFGKIYILSMI